MLEDLKLFGQPLNQPQPRVLVVVLSWPGEGATGNFGLYRYLCEICSMATRSSGIQL